MILAALALRLAPGGSLTFDLEGRARVEALDHEPDSTTFRLMPSIKASRGIVTLFVQPMLAVSLSKTGRDDPTQQSGVDLLQAYAAVGAPDRLTLRAGRAMVKLGSERLVGARLGTNVPRAFDGVDIAGKLGRAQFDLFALRQVKVGPSAFDDHATGQGRLLGVYGTLPVRSWRSTLDLYLLDTHFQRPRFGAEGLSDRVTIGARVAGQRRAWSWNWEAMAQAGEADGRSIRAWSLATDTGYRFAVGNRKIQADLKANIASGGERGRVLRNFDPLFPKAKYFGELTPVGPSNMANLHAVLSTGLGARTSVGVMLVGYARLDRSAPAYRLSGQPIEFPVGAGRFIGRQVEVTGEFAPAKGVDLSLSVSRFRSARELEQVGSLRSTTMAAIEVGFAR